MRAMKLEWVEPPKEAFIPVPGGLYGDLAVELRKNKDKWAIVPREFASHDSAKNTATRIRTGRMAAMPKGEFEAVAHESKIYVRWVGTTEEGEGGDSPTPPGVRSISSRRATPENVSASIRAWAKTNGYPDLPAHGRLPQEVIVAYHAAMDEKESGGDS